LLITGLLRRHSENLEQNAARYELIIVDEEAKNEAGSKHMDTQQEDV